MELHPGDCVLVHLDAFQRPMQEAEKQMGRQHSYRD